VARKGFVRNARNILAGKPEGKKQLGRARRKLEDNIKMNLKGWGVDWIHLAQNRDQCRALVTSWETVRLSRTLLNEIS
jgi:hypothetical protein